MKENQQKKVFTKFIIALSFLLLVFSCQKNSSKVEIPQNEPLLIKSSEMISIRASDVISTINSFKRKIEIINNIDKNVLQTFEISVISTNIQGDIYEALKNKTFSGTMEISSGSTKIISKEFKQGKLIPKISKINDSNITYLANPDEELAPECSATTVHDCVASRINAMNWIDYGLCLASAPACYGGLWASCTWDVCYK